MLVVRLLQSIIVLCMVGIALVLFQAGATATGQVIFSQDYRAPGATEALSFDNVADLQVFQSNLQSQRPDYYTFRATKGAFLKIKLLTLQLVGQDDLRPSLTLFGPGLPPSTPDEVKQLPFTLPASAGLVLVEADNSNKAAHEPWTQAGYWERQTMLYEIPEDGAYFVAVYSLTGQSCKYALVVGDKAKPGLREILSFPITWLRVRYWFNDLWWPSFSLVVLGLGLVAGGWYYGRTLRRQIRALSITKANVRRFDLRPKLARPGWKQRRVYRRIRCGPLQRLIPTRAVSPSPLEALESEESPSSDSNSNKESLGTTRPLPATANGPHISATEQTAPEQDGLARWEERFHPKNKQTEEEETEAANS
jgi:hypothetical protein